MHTEVADANQKLYICPGETEPISYSVHLGRLAQLYPACQHCPLNCESGSAGDGIVDRLALKSDRQRAEVRLSHGRIRGVYLNQIDRRVAGDIVGQFADRLWTETRRAVRTHRREKVEAWDAPLVVIGYDQRPSSPDIVTGVQDRLRLMGCDVIDIGLATGPALQYAVRLNKAIAGVFVTGSNCSPAWTGLDFFSSDGTATEVESIKIPRAGDRPMQHARPVRSSGRHTFRPVHENYSVRLRRYVRPRRNMTVCIGTEDRTTRELIRATLRELGEEAYFIELPKRVRQLSDLDDPDTQRVSAAVLATNADLGIVIDEDSRGCVLLDDHGEPLYPSESLALLEEYARVAAVVDDNVYEFPEQSIRCDAVLTLAHAVTAVSALPGTLSDFVANESKQ